MSVFLFKIIGITPKISFSEHIYLYVSPERDIRRQLDIWMPTSSIYSAPRNIQVLSPSVPCLGALISVRSLIMHNFQTGSHGSDQGVDVVISTMEKV